MMEVRPPRVVPLVGVGLYRSGYFRQTVDVDGFQQHIYPGYDFARLSVLPVQAPAQAYDVETNKWDLCPFGPLPEGRLGSYVGNHPYQDKIYVAGGWWALDPGPPWRR